MTEMGIVKTFIPLFFAALILGASSPVFSGSLCFEEAGKLHGINPKLLKSIAKVESGLNPAAVNLNKNGSEDLGIMQINSAWIQSLNLCRKRLLADACYNINTGAKILRNCIDRWDYTWYAVGCYSAVSKPKKVNYSWKIYRELIKEREKNIETGKDDGKAGLTKTQNDGFLYFKVRNLSDHKTGENQ